MFPVLSGISPETLTQMLSPLPRFRAVQIIKWIASGVSSFDEMGNVPLELRKELAERFTLRPNVSVEKHHGADGTVKLALQFSDGAKIESVLLADGSRRRAPRYTACLSTQAGCPAGCVFCKTGAGFRRNLSSAEMTEQFLQLGKAIPQAAPASVNPARRRLPIANIVVMGMGEPLLNMEELRRALAVICYPEGMNFSRRRITVSTCGIAPGIIDLADNGPAVRLALSLTTGDEELRRRLMPITKNHSLGDVKEALRYFQNAGGGRITLEAVLLGGINTRKEDAAGIVRFAEGLDTAVNLIPWNPVTGLEFEGSALREPSADEVETFSRRLEAAAMNVTRRYRRGRSVMGACGQLGTSENLG